MSFWNSIMGVSNGGAGNSSLAQQQAQSSNTQHLAVHAALSQGSTTTAAMQALANHLSQQNQLVFKQYQITPILFESDKFAQLTKIRIKMNQYNLITMIEFKD